MKVLTTRRKILRRAIPVSLNIRECLRLRACARVAFSRTFQAEPAQCKEGIFSVHWGSVKEAGSATSAVGTPSRHPPGVILSWSEGRSHGIVNYRGVHSQGGVDRQGTLLVADAWVTDWELPDAARAQRGACGVAANGSPSFARACFSKTPRIPCAGLHLPFSPPRSAKKSQVPGRPAGCAYLASMEMP